MNFAKGFQKIISKEYPNLDLWIYQIKGQPSEVTGLLFAKNVIGFHKEEWERNNSSGRKILVKARILDLLYGLRDFIEDDIERIKDEKG